MQKFQLERRFYVQPMCRAFHVEAESSLMAGSPFQGGVGHAGSGGYVPAKQGTFVEEEEGSNLEH